MYFCTLQFVSRQLYYSKVLELFASRKFIECEVNKNAHAGVPYRQKVSPDNIAHHQRLLPHQMCSKPSICLRGEANEVSNFKTSMKPQCLCDTGNELKLRENKFSKLCSTVHE